MYCVLVVISSIQSNGRSESVTSLVAQHCWHWPFRWPLPCPWLKQTAIDHHSQSYWLSKAVCLIVCKSRQSKQNNCHFSFPPFVAVAYLSLMLLQCLCSRPVFDNGHTSQSATFEAQIGDPPPQSHISLLFSLATITINSSTSEGSEEQLINHMHPLLVSWRPSWLYWSVSLILHCFDSLFSHPFS